jgi:hypothetical protein
MSGAFQNFEVDYRWKTQAMLIRLDALDGGPDKFLADLGYDERRKIGETSRRMSA